MRKLIVVMLVVLGVGLSAQEPSSVPEIPFDAEAPLTLPPDLYFGEVAGVAVNSRGHVFVYSRTGSAGHVVGPRAAQLFEFGPDGSFIREIGKNLYAMAWAHAVRIDADDNIWIVDNGSDMAVKLSPEGRVLLVLGRRRESVAALHLRPPDPPGSPPRPATGSAATGSRSMPRFSRSALMRRKAVVIGISTRLSSKLNAPPPLLSSTPITVIWRPFTFILRPTGLRPPYRSTDACAPSTATSDALMTCGSPTKSPISTS